MLAPPRAIAQLSSTSINNSTRFQISDDVYTILGDGRKKRSELAVAIDGEGIEIHNVRSNGLISSYAIPPGDRFTCAPHSILDRFSKPGQTTRRTYCAVEGSKSRILCFVQGSKEQDALSKRSITLTAEITDCKSSIILLETSIEAIDYDSSPTLVLYVVHEDGRVRCLAGDLSQEYWNSNAPPKGKEILSAFILDIDEARRGFFKNREDVWATITMGGRLDGSQKSILGILTQGRPKNLPPDPRLHFYTLAKGSLDSRTLKSHLEHGNLPHILSVIIPQPKELQDASGRFSIHKRSGKIYQHHGPNLGVYDCAGPSPRLEHLVALKDEIISCLSLSSGILAVTSPTVISILDMRWHALQAIGPVEPSEANHGEDGRIDVYGNTSNVQLISYFPLLQSVVAVQGRNLISFSVIDSEPGYGHNKKRRNQGTLAAAVGQGIRHKAPQVLERQQRRMPEGFGSKIRPKFTEDEWEQLKMAWNSLYYDDIDTFDDTVVKELEASAIGANGKALAPLVAIDQRIISFVISKVFVLNPREPSNSKDNQKHRLGVEMIPAKSFKWLSSNGLLTVRHVESSLKSLGLLPVTEILPPDEIIHSLGTYDPSLQTLLYFLDSAVALSTEELVSALCRALKILQQAENLSNIKRITGEENVDYGVVESDDEMQQIESNLSHSSSVHEGDADKIHDAHSVMKTCLAKLADCHDKDIQKTFKYCLLPTEILAVVDYLRMDLASGGWFSRHADDEIPIPEDISRQTSQINIDTKVLNCAIDSLGSAAWLLGTFNGLDTAESHETIAYMRAETMAALEGIEEAVCLEGMLRQVLLYSKLVPQIPKLDPSQPIVPITRPENALPIGYKRPPGRKSKRIGAGGEVQVLSSRDVAQLKSRQVGPYSFERILI